MTKEFWLGFAAYLLPTFPLGYFWHLNIFKAHYDRLEMYRQDVIIPMGLATMIIQAAFFSWAYPKLFSTAKDAWLTSSLQAAAIFGVLAWSFAVLPVAAKYRMVSVSEFIKLETAFTIMQFIVVTPLIALAHRQP